MNEFLRSPLDVRDEPGSFFAVVSARFLAVACVCCPSRTKSRICCVSGSRYRLMRVFTLPVLLRRASAAQDRKKERIMQNDPMKRKEDAGRETKVGFMLTKFNCLRLSLSLIEKVRDGQMGDQARYDSQREPKGDIYT